MKKATNQTGTIPPILIMGVAGSGKTTCGRRLAQSLDVEFLDADDFHSADNIARMRAGIPLGDVQRRPWLERLAHALKTHGKDEGPIVACSALKQAYRDQLLSAVPRLRVIYLRAAPALIRQRLQTRSTNLISPALIDSQFMDLEEPPDAVEIDASIPVELAMAQILTGMDLKATGSSE